MKKNNLTKQDKAKIDSEVLNILRFLCGVLKINFNRMDKRYMTLAIDMFVEGCRYVHNKEKEEKERLVKGFAYEK
jgi:hypothetical protein